MAWSCKYLVRRVAGITEKSNDMTGKHVGARLKKHRVLMAYTYSFWGTTRECLAGNKFNPIWTLEN